MAELTVNSLPKHTVKSTAWRIINHPIYNRNCKYFDSYLQKGCLHGDECAFKHCIAPKYYQQRPQQIQSPSIQIQQQQPLHPQLSNNDTQRIIHELNARCAAMEKLIKEDIEKGNKAPSIKQQNRNIPKKRQRKKKNKKKKQKKKKQRRKKAPPHKQKNITSKQITPTTTSTALGPNESASNHSENDRIPQHSECCTSNHSENDAKTESPTPSPQPQYKQQQQQPQTGDDFKSLQKETSDNEEITRIGSNSLLCSLRNKRKSPPMLQMQSIQILLNKTPKRTLAKTQTILQKTADSK